jgi:hypothetical protein
MEQTMHLTAAELEDGLDHVRAAPADEGRVELIVRRPAVDEREVLAEATLDLVAGLVGDTWPSRGKVDINAQVTVMSARVAALVGQSPERWPLAGDQLYVDFDISHANLPAGSRLEIGTAVIEVSARPHLGCSKFRSRFGDDALGFVNSPVGRDLRLRGLNARIVVPGTIRQGDAVRKRPAEPERREQ